MPGAEVSASGASFASASTVVAQTRAYESACVVDANETIKASTAEQSTVKGGFIWIDVSGPHRCQVQALRDSFFGCQTLDPEHTGTALSLNYLALLCFTVALRSLPQRRLLVNRQRLLCRPIALVCCKPKLEGHPRCGIADRQAFAI